VPVLDSGARGATITFTERHIGDVLLAWENEALLTLKETPGKFEVVIPSLSILAEPPVAVVDKNVDKHGTHEVAAAYLQFLYTEAGQELAAKHFYRPRNPVVAARHSAAFPAVNLVTVDGAFGGWAKAQQEHFDDGATFDQIYAAKRP
jgi:sulfate transport system substrate-binding protein